MDTPGSASYVPTLFFQTLPPVETTRICKEHPLLEYQLGQEATKADSRR